MKWEKHGRVFVPSEKSDWMVSHASNPVAVHEQEDRFKIYFSTRDINKRSSVGYVVIDLNSPQEILEQSTLPVLSPGEAGLFDDSGISLGSVLKFGNQIYLYYVGWNLSRTVPWRNSIGLAISKGGARFEKVGLAPVLDRSNLDPFSLSYPCVIRDSDGFRMWYGSNVSWGKSGSDMIHGIRHAESTDGIHWNVSDEWCLKPDLKTVQAYARPWVRKMREGYEMWYSYRGSCYRIGYAISQDGIHWTKDDGSVGIEASGEGWENTSIEYPCVFSHKGQDFLLYNGDGYGLTGFGLASRPVARS